MCFKATLKVGRELMLLMVLKKVLMDIQLKALEGNVSRWENNSSRGGGSQSRGRSGDVQKIRYGCVTLWGDFGERS